MRAGGKIGVNFLLVKISSSTVDNAANVMGDCSIVLCQQTNCELNYG